MFVTLAEDLVLVPQHLCDGLQASLTPVLGDQWPPQALGMHIVHIQLFRQKFILTNLKLLKMTFSFILLICVCKHILSASARMLGLKLWRLCLASFASVSGP